MLCAANASYAQSMLECEENCANDHADAYHQEQYIIQRCSLNKAPAYTEEDLETTAEATSLVFKPLRSADTTQKLATDRKINQF